MNKCVLIGNLGKDPETRYGANNTAVTRFSVGVNRKFKRDGEKDTDWLNCVAFGKTAEFVDKYFRKGMRVALSGRIQTGDYTNREGVKVYTTDIVVEECEFCEKKSREEPAAVPKADNDFMDVNIDDGEFPF